MGRVKLPLFFWLNGLWSFFCSCFGTQVNWNHQSTVTIGKKHTKILTFSIYFSIETNKSRFFCLFVFKAEEHCHVQVYLWLAEKSHDPVEDAGLERAVFQLGLVLVVLKSFLSKLSHKLKVPINTNTKFLWSKYGAQGGLFCTSSRVS